MKTNRSMMFIVIFLCFCLVFAASAWPAEQKSGPGRQIITSPALVAPAKEQPAAVQKANITNVQPQVIVASPDEGATFYGGQTCDIKWMAIGIPAGSKMKIEFIRSDSTKQILGDNLSIPGNFQWKINEQAFLKKQIDNPYGGMPSYLPQNTQGKLKLTTSSEGKTYENERSISILIPGLKITNPKVGDILHVNQTYTVTWQNIGPPIPKVDIMIGAGSGYASIPSYTTNVANTGSASITIPVSALFANWTGSYWLSVQSSLISFPESYIHDIVTINMMK
jgi:hypothetical protein